MATRKIDASAELVDSVKPVAIGERTVPAITNKGARNITFMGSLVMVLKVTSRADSERLHAGDG